MTARVLDVETPELPAPAFDLEAMDGTRVSLADLSDKVVVLNFWATWCPPCVEEMPSFIELVNSVSEPDVVFLAVSADDDWEPVRAFFDEPPPFPVLLDAGGKLARSYGTTKFPETYVIRNGRIEGYIIGPRAWNAWYALEYVRSLTSSRS